MNSVIKSKSPYIVVSFTLGIISIMTAILWYISIPAGILAIVFGNTGKKTVGSKLASAAKILGIIGISISGALLIIFYGILILKIMGL